MIEKLDVYKRLKQLNILGEERRLEWADAITRIRTQRELLDLSYRVDRQRLLASAPGKPANVDFFASTMRVQLALLHEEDLLRFLADLRDSGNAYYAVRQCSLTRTGAAAGRHPDLAAPARRVRDRPHHHHRPGGQGMKPCALHRLAFCSPAPPCKRRSSAACSSRPSSALRSTRGARRACPTGRRQRRGVAHHPPRRLREALRRALDGLRQRRSDARGHGRRAAWSDPRRRGGRVAGARRAKAVPARRAAPRRSARPRHRPGARRPRRRRPRPSGPGAQMRRRERQQSGAALMALLAVLVLGVPGGWLPRSTTPKPACRWRPTTTPRVLSAGEDRAIRYVAHRALMAAEDNPGRLPCPEAAGWQNNHDGVSYIVRRWHCRRVAARCPRSGGCRGARSASTSCGRGRRAALVRRVSGLGVGTLSRQRTDHQLQYRGPAQPRRRRRVSRSSSRRADRCSSRPRRLLAWRATSRAGDSRRRLGPARFSRVRERDLARRRAFRRCRPGQLVQRPGDRGDGAGMSGCDRGRGRRAHRARLVPHLQSVYAGAEWGTSATNPVFPFAATLRRPGASRHSRACWMSARACFR